MPLLDKYLIHSVYYYLSEEEVVVVKSESKNSTSHWEFSDKLVTTFPFLS